jgi:general secretion pathway protein D
VLPGHAEAQDPTAAQQVFRGTDRFVNAIPGREAGSKAAPGDITLDFVDTDVRDVVRSVLGDMLQLPYTLDPQVTGRVTLRTGGPIAKLDVLPALEASLSIVGVAIVPRNGAYDVRRVADLQHGTGELALNGSGREPGYGIEIVPLRFVAAEQMQKLLSPVAPQGALVHIDPTRNLIFIAGSEPERNSLKQTIAMFDVNYLKSMSFSIVRPIHVDVGVLAAELDKVFEGTDSPIAGLVRLIPIPRINSLLVVSSRASYLEDVSAWVTRLDVAPAETGRRLYYYRLQNARAADVASTLSQLFGGATASATSAGQPTGTTSASVPSSSAASQGNLQVSYPTPQALASSEPATLTTGPASAASGANNGNAPQIVTDQSNNALIIRADPGDYAAIERILHEMDVAPAQVMIEATIIEVTLNDQLQLGVEWYFRNANSQTFTLSGSATGAITQSFPGFAFGYVLPNVQVAVSALGTLTKVTVLSSPQILTLDNKPATLQVGDEVPVVTQTALSVNGGGAPLVSTVQMQDTGVILSVTPRIAKSGMVFLDISQEVSDSVPTTTSGIDSPTIKQRRLQSTVGVLNGQSVALGGMISHSDTTGNSGIPFLKDIPILGNLARSSNEEHDRTELVIFLTPHIIGNVDEAESVTNELKHNFSQIQDELREYDETHSSKPAPH